MRQLLPRSVLAIGRGLASYVALLGGVGCLGWLALRLEAVPTLNWSPWEGSAGLNSPLVVLDAGHGGHDGGAVAGGMIEKVVALELTQRVRFHLEHQGVRVKMTRNRDVFIPLEERSSIANNQRAAAFVSLHLNTSVAAPEVSGIETYFSNRKSLLQPRPSGGGPLPPPSQMREALGEKLARSVQQHACLMSHAEDRGIRERGYAVVLHTRCPAALVECGFLTHSGEAAKLKQADYQERLAKGIARGIAEFLKAQALQPAVAEEAPAHEEPVGIIPVAEP